MSYDLIKFVRSVKCRPTVKHVALTLATYADKENYCYPSIALLMEDTGLSNRCVIDCLRELEIQKVISADRSNGRHTYYTFTMDDYAGPVNVKTETSGMQSGSPVNVKQQPVNVKQQPVNVKQQPVNVTAEDCREVHTNNQLTTIEQPIGTANKRTTKKQTKNIGYPKPEGVDQMYWDGWLAVRKIKNAPMNDAVMDFMVREAAKAKISIPEAVRICAGKNWQNFTASWYKPEQVQPKEEPKDKWNFDDILPPSNSIRTIQPDDHLFQGVTYEH